MSDFAYQVGVFADANPVIINCGGKHPPMTATLNSTFATRKIELSTDGGVNYYQPNYDANSVGQMVMVIMAPISHVKFTGQAGDAWNIR